MITRHHAWQRYGRAAAQALIAILLVVSSFANLPARPVQAAGGWVVNDAGDAGPGSCDSGCTLRDAIAQAQPGDMILFNLEPPATITLTQGEIVVDKTLTLWGSGVDQLTVDGGGASRIFKVTGGKFTVSDMTLQNGRIVGDTGKNPDGGAFNGAGGAIYVAPLASVVISNMVLQNNVAVGGAGGNGGVQTDTGYSAAGGGGMGGAGDDGSGSQPGGFGGGGGGSAFWSQRTGANGGFGGGGGGSDGGAGGQGGTGGGNGGGYGGKNGYGGGGGGAGMGGAIFIDGGADQPGLLEIHENVTFKDNQATGGSGGNGDGAGGGGGGGAGIGGAVFNNGSLYMPTPATFTNNTAQGGKGGAPGPWANNPGGDGSAVPDSYAEYSGLYDYTRLNVMASTTTVSGATLDYSADARTLPLTAQVETGAGPASGGTVTFSVLDSGQSPIASDVTSEAVTNGTASVDFPLPAGLAAGAYTIVAKYSGTVEINLSQGTAALEIKALPATVTVSNVTASASRLPLSVTLTAAVSGAGKPAASGLVNFTVKNAQDQQVGEIVSGSVQNGTAQAQFFASGLAAGTYSILANFTGSSTLAEAAGQGTLTVGASTSTSTVTELKGPQGSQYFGFRVTALPNGNIVLSDPIYSATGQNNYGAVYLVNGETHAIISTMKGSRPDDFAGSGGIVVLSDGNFLISSPQWSNDSASSVGAVTWCSAVTGCPATVTAENSLTGTHESDAVGVGYNVWGPANIQVLPGGAYIVTSHQWDNGAAQDTGAVTYCKDASACTGVVVSAENSLTGQGANNRIGENHPVTLLKDGSYVVASEQWAPEGNSFWGAYTLCRVDGTPHGACAGKQVTAANSLTGTRDSDAVSASVTPLAGGGYVVATPNYSTDAGSGMGAATLCSVSGDYGSCGGKQISAENSLLGPAEGANTGYEATALAGGGYVVVSSGFSTETAAYAGAVTYCTAEGSCTGKIVSTENSLTGGVSDAWIGEVDYAATGQRGVTALPDGRYVVVSPWWSSETVQYAGAVTVCAGDGSCNGKVVSAANSMIGMQEYDEVGADGVVVLKDGSFVIASPYWNKSTAEYAGAITWCSLKTGCPATITAENSLTGQSGDDYAGEEGVVALANGGFVALSSYWDNPALGEDGYDIGAVTVCKTAEGCMGKTITAENSLTGLGSGDSLGEYSPDENWSRIKALDWGGFIFPSTYIQDGENSDVGAASLCRLDSCQGPVSDNNTVTGKVQETGYEMAYDYDAVHGQLIMGMPKENRVVFYSLAKAGTQMTLTASAGPKLNEPVTFTAQVTSPSGLPGGEVTFKDGATVLGKAALSANGTAELAVTFKTSGEHQVTAEYGGSANFTAASKEISITFKVSKLYFWLPLINK